MLNLKINEIPDISVASNAELIMTENQLIQGILGSGSSSIAYQRADLDYDSSDLFHMINDIKNIVNFQFGDEGDFTFDVSVRFANMLVDNRIKMSPEEYGREFCQARDAINDKFDKLYEERADKKRFTHYFDLHEVLGILDNSDLVKIFKLNQYQVIGLSVVMSMFGYQGFNYREFATMISSISETLAVLSDMGVHMDAKHTISLCIVLGSAYTRKEAPPHSRKLNSKMISESTKTLASSFDFHEDIIDHSEKIKSLNMDFMNRAFSISDRNKLHQALAEKRFFLNSMFPMPLIYSKSKRGIYTRSLRKMTAGNTVDSSLAIYLSTINALEPDYNVAIDDAPWSSDQVEKVGFGQASLWLNSMWSGNAALKWIEADYSLDRANKCFDEYGVTNPDDHQLIVNSASSSWLSSWSESESE